MQIQCNTYLTTLFRQKYKQNDIDIYSSLIGSNRIMVIGFFVRKRFLITYHYKQEIMNMITYYPNRTEYRFLKSDIGGVLQDIHFDVSTNPIDVGGIVHHRVMWVKESKITPGTFILGKEQYWTASNVETKVVVSEHLIAKLEQDNLDMYEPGQVGQATPFEPKAVVELPPDPRDGKSVPERIDEILEPLKKKK